MQAGLNFRKQQAFAAVDPGDRGSVSKEKMSLAAENRHFPSVPGIYRSIEYQGPVGREYWAEFCGRVRRVMSALHWLSGWEQLDVDLTSATQKHIPRVKATPSAGVV